MATKPEYKVVEIDETTCIGCTKCIQACPVDAIIGASKQMHQVLTEYCIGCGLCLPPCPVNCITIKPQDKLSPERRREQAQIAKNRHQARKRRLEYTEAQKSAVDNHIINTDLKNLIADSLSRVQQKSRPFKWDPKDE